MGRQYNYIYSNIVEGEGDITGHIAYSLYKQDKIRFIENFKIKNNVEELSEEDLQPFHSITSSQSNIDRYKMQSVAILQNFLNDILSSATEQIERDCTQRHKEMLAEVVKDMKPKGFWYGIFQSVIGAFVFMLLLCLLMFFLNFSETQYTFTIGGSGSAKLEATE